MERGFRMINGMERRFRMINDSISNHFSIPKTCESSRSIPIESNSYHEMIFDAAGPSFFSHEEMNHEKPPKIIEAKKILSKFVKCTKLRNVNSNIIHDEIQNKISEGFEDWFRLEMHNPTKQYSQLLKNLSWAYQEEQVLFLPYPGYKRPRIYLISAIKSRLRVIDVPVQDDAFKENVDVHEALIIDVMIEDLRLLVHEPRSSEELILTSRHISRSYKQ
ncbi:hypothetical protein M9H77_27932 [Catharanthus roseus]|uniref:Uncharacterized protein n=1 Tax=Catharanthus roseus TaxID=4058 RepID=A0ACC0AEA6_CATRO|nr:hypothetical protein M9H77_27932 [Catharanthus roseus]